MRLAHKIVVFIAYFNVLVGSAHRSLNRTHRLGVFHLRQFRCNATGDAAKHRGGLLARRLQHRLSALVSAGEQEQVGFIRYSNSDTDYPNIKWAQCF